MISKVTDDIKNSRVVDIEWSKAIPNIVWMESWAEC